jgi:hypothetical protein
MPRKQDPADAGDFMPTKEEILSKPLPPEPPQTPTQVGLSYLNNLYKVMPAGLSAQAFASGIADLLRNNPSPASLLATLGTLPTDVHRATGALGRTSAEPRGMYNLGIRSPGERPAGDVDIGIPDDYAGGDIDLAEAIRREQIANELTSADLAD